MACTVAMAFHVRERTKSLDRAEYRNPFGPSRIFVLPYLGIVWVSKLLILDPIFHG
jgi:hypothetical protein